jgi:hypothetical protein
MSEAIIKNGGVWLAKALADHEVWKLDPCSRGQAWADLLLLANDQERKFMVRGNLVTVCRGQLGWSKVNLAKRWRWSVEKLNGFLEYLQMAGMIRVESNSLTTLITLSNYESYQKHLGSGVDLAADPRTDLVAEPVSGSATETAADPRTDLVAEPVSGSATETAADPRTGPVADSVTDPRQKVEGRRKEEGKEKGATRAREGLSPSWDQVVEYCEGAKMDYSREEIRGAWTELEATKDAGGVWAWGKRQVTDWRAAIESRMASNRERGNKQGGARARAHYHSSQGSGLSAEIRGLMLPGDLEGWWTEPADLVEAEMMGLALGDEVQKKTARRIREVLRLRRGK